MSSIYFGGSRSLTPLPIIEQVVSAVLQAGHSVHVGCSSGADAHVISAVSPSSFLQLRVFAAFAQSGAGSWSGSAVRLIQSWARCGAPVQWLAGGALSIPLAGRLINRSLAAFQGCSSAVFFFPGYSSLSVAFQAFSAGIPIFAFGDQPAPVALQGGQWVESSYQGFTCWQWQPAQLSFL